MLCNKVPLTLAWMPSFFKERPCKQTKLPKEVFLSFIWLLPYLNLNKDKKRATEEITLFIQALHSEALEALAAQQILLIKHNAKIFRMMVNNVAYDFTISIELMAELETKCNRLKAPNEKDLLRSLRNTFMAEASKVQQAQMATVTKEAPRNYIGGFAMITKDLWALSLVRKKNQKLFHDLNTHVFIILEGIENQREVLYKIHLRVGSKGRVTIEKAPETDIERLKGISQGQYCYKGWQITTTQKDKLLESIQLDQLLAEEGQLVYNRYGNGDIYRLSFPNGRSYHNCLSWAEAKLKELDLPMERHWLDVIVTLPSEHLKKAEERPNQCLIA